MTRTIMIFVLAMLLSDVYCQTTKEYFFNETLPLNDSSALVLLIREPQTDFAKNLNHRIYRDTNLIKMINENWYQEIEEGEEKIMHFCDFDMFFYLLEGKKSRYLNRMNSRCGLSEINCKDLSILGQYGSPLRVDTIFTISDTLSKEKLFNRNYIFYSYPNRQEWNYSSTAKYPKIYYDYSTTIELTLDTNYTIKENIENYIKTFTSDFTGINYNSWGEHVPDFDKRMEVKKFIHFKEPCELEFTLFITKERISSFKSLDFENIEFTIEDKEHPLIVFYSD